MSPVGFEPTIPVGERQRTYALDCVATGTVPALGECNVRIFKTDPIVEIIKNVAKLGCRAPVRNF